MVQNLKLLNKKQEENKMIERLHNTMDLMERIVSFLEGLKRLSYIDDYVVTHTIKESEEIIKLVEELKTALWENAREDTK